MLLLWEKKGHILKYIEIVLKYIWGDIHSVHKLKSNQSRFL